MLAVLLVLFLHYSNMYIGCDGCVAWYLVAWSVSVGVGGLDNLIVENVRLSHAHSTCISSIHRTQKIKEASLSFLSSG